MKIIHSIIILNLIISCSIAACSKSGKKAYPIDNYKSWKKPLNRILDYPVPGHGDTLRIIYANDSAYNSKMRKDNNGINKIIMDDGAIIIKEIYKTKDDYDKKKLDSIVVMIKDSKNRDSRGGWLYYVKPADKEMMQIKGIMCVGCHEAANEKHPYFDGNKKEIFRDYIFFPIVK